ncbi:sugar phosphate isomerase/epimerase [Treponema sp. OMZ 840]|uniref:sugar phosphate isomerase/epimerase family protein n=1 Tax=Treponema sp. OMZ 840 TaxID=244313 RepID=UPI003D926A84
MKLGFVSSILTDWNFYEVLDIANDLGFSCVEIACWPQEKAERRYAGVSHIDTQNLTKEKINTICDYCKKKSVTISSLAYYPNPMDPDLQKRENVINHLYSVITASQMLKVNMVTTFIGRDPQKTIEENLEMFSKVWPPIIKFAAEHGVKIAIENCPMLFDRTQWPGGQNIFTSPVIWREIFKIIPDRNFGINFDPSHFIWQQMDYIQPIYEFQDRLFHIHFKDIKILKNKLQENGILAYPLSYMSPKIPGLGDVNWSKFISALTDIGYDGPACIEVEDRAFEYSQEAVLNSLRQSKKYIDQFVV